jgi:hypothetical protein
MRYFTLILGLVLTGASLVFAVADGGNIDFYRRPLSIAWLVVTILTTTRPQSGIRDIIARAWWIQPFAPIVIFALSVACVNAYEPFPLK